MNRWIFIIGILGISPIISLDSAFAQTIQVNQTTPCFLNYNQSTSYQIWDDCGMDEDWLQASLIGFEWVTGGYFSMIFAGVLILFTYIKYHKLIYPLIIGIAFLPISFFLFPTEFLLFALIMAGVGIGITIYKIVKNQTSEFN
jgi:hypothetical protein